MKHSCNYVFSGKCPKVYNTIRPKKQTSKATTSLYKAGAKLIKNNGTRTDKKPVQTIQFDVDIDQYRKGKQATAKYHRPYKQEFTRIVVNGKTLFVFNE